MMHRAALAVVAWGALSGVATAGSPADIYPDLDPPDRSNLPDTGLHVIGGAGIDLGYISAGADIGFGGLHALVGLGADRIAVLGEIDGALVGDRHLDPEGAAYGRVAIEARLSLWQGKVREQRRHARFVSIARGDLWLEPGLGYERADQVTGTTLSRGDVSLAIGYQTTQWFGSSFNGTYIGVRVIVARAPTTPSDSGMDTSVLFTTGLLFGK
jgi:hypothetical protein